MYCDCRSFGVDLHLEEISTERYGDVMRGCYTIGTVLDAKQPTGAASRAAALALGEGSYPRSRAAR
jgi:hypothetical protein